MPYIDMHFGYKTYGFLDSCLKCGKSYSDMALDGDCNTYYVPTDGVVRSWFLLCDGCKSELGAIPVKRDDCSPDILGTLPDFKLEKAVPVNVKL